MRSRESLHALARINGVLAEYHRGGTRVQVGEEPLRAILKLLGCDVRNERAIRASLCEARQNLSEQRLQPVTVIWQHKAQHVLVRMPARMLSRTVRISVRTEDGGVNERDIQPGQCTQRQPSACERNMVSVELPLPELPIGYHSMEVHFRDRTATSFIISAPTQAWHNPQTSKKWGLFAPVYATHSAESWGGGNLTDYGRLARWLGSQGGAFLGLLPVLSVFVGKGQADFGPYAPASRLFWNEFFVDVTALPEFVRSSKAQRRAGSRSFTARLERFRKNPLVSYPEEMQARREILEILAEDFFRRPSERRTRFETHLKNHPELEDYARFRACMEERNAGWHKWPSRMRAGRLGPGDYSESVRNYFLYTQWVAQKQIDALTAEAQRAGVSLYLDLPLGVHSASYDTWRNQDVFVRGASVGAPPDQFFSGGQNWGFAPPHPLESRLSRYKYFRQVLDFHMRSTGLLRIDHVMCLHRLFWIPHGMSARDGVYVQYPDEELYALLCLESHRHKTMIVGENLGTVPPEVNTSLRRHGFSGMYVLQFNTRENRKALSDPDEQELASIGTHDTATFAGFWTGSDIESRSRLGVTQCNESSSGQVENDCAQRARMVARIEHYLTRGKWMNGRGGSRLQAALLACLRFLAGSKAQMVMVSLEDLLLEQEPHNVPGTTDEHPNWRRKARLSLEELFSSRRIRTILHEVNRIRRKLQK